MTRSSSDQDGPLRGHRAPDKIPGSGARQVSLLRPVLGVAGALARGLAMPWKRTAEGCELTYVTTADGWVLPLRRVRRSERPPLGPLLLQHGLGSNHMVYLFPGRSLASRMADLGFDCWVPDLRGRGLARPPRGVRRWTTSDYVDQDLPAIVDAILTRTGYDDLLWVGHSMGGVLLYMYGIRHGTRRIRAAVASAATLDYRVGETSFRALLPHRERLARLPNIPFGTLMSLSAPFHRRLGMSGRGDLYNPENLEPKFGRQYLASAYEDIATGVLLSLSSTFGPRGFQHPDGLTYLEEAGRFTAPLLAMAGAKDQQVSPEAVAATLGRVGSKTRRFMLVCREAGFSVDPGHVDLINGIMAPSEVWPLIERWLIAHPPR